MDPRSLGMFLKICSILGLKKWLLPVPDGPAAIPKLHVSLTRFRFSHSQMTAFRGPLKSPCLYSRARFVDVRGQPGIYFDLSGY